MYYLRLFYTCYLKLKLSLHQLKTITMKFKHLSLGFLLSLVAIEQAQSATWFVNHAATGTQSGVSWNDAYKDLQIAIDNSSAGDTIWVAKGTYYPTMSANGSSTNNRDKAFVLKNNIHVFGGFKGDEIFFGDRLQDSVSLHVTNRTILSGDLGNLNNNSDNAYHVVIASGISLFSMDGFTIKDGHANGNTPLVLNGRNIYRHYAGGIYNDSVSGTYNNIIIYNNIANSFADAEGGGAGMYNYKGDLNITNSTFINNEAINSNGGGMKNESTSPLISHVRFANNVALTTDEGGGGVNNINSSNAIFNYVIFEENTTNASGGGVYNDNSSPHFNHVIFLNNYADICGGGVDADGNSHVVFTNVEFIGNYAAADGGGLFAWKSSPIMTNVSFYDNRADNNGGGAYTYNTCNPIMTNVIFHNNSAGNHYGGLGVERNSVATITNAEFSKNKAINNGGGIGSHDNHGTIATLILTNVTIANNSATDGGGGYDHGTTTQFRNSIVVGNYPNDIDINPALIANAQHVIAGNGAFGTVFIEDGSINPLGTAVSWPFFVDTATNNYHLIVGSPAIDMGDNNFFASSGNPDLSSITTDLAGADRIMGSSVDIGAYEYCTQTFAPQATISVNPGAKVAHGISVTFELTLSNEGTDPTIEWWKNSTSILSAANQLTYTGIAGVDFASEDTIWAKITSSAPCVSPDTVISNKIVMEISLNTENLSKDLYKITIAPNPNRGKFVINGQLEQGKNYTLCVRDLLGREIMKKIYSTDLSNKEINLGENVSSGVYFLSIQGSDGGAQTLKFVVK